MRSLAWTVAVYVATGLVAWRLGLISLRTHDERRIVLAVLLVLAGVHSTAVRTGAEDVAARPIVLETAARGLLDTLALLVVLPLVARTRWLRTLGAPGAAALLCYLVVCGVSTLYSAAPIVTAGKTFELGVALLVVLAAVGSQPRGAVPRARSLVRTIVLFEAGLLITAVVGFFVMPATFSLVESRPGFFLPQVLTSPYTHSNGLSSIGALVSVYAFAEFFTGSAGRERRVWALLGALGVVGAGLASGRQGVVIWVASMAVLLWVCRRRWLVFLVAPGLIGVAVTYHDLIREILTRGQATVTLSTWSGRLSYWAAALDVWTEHPWLGYGFGVGGRFVALKSISSDSVSSLHSGYMEALTGVGLLGLIPLGVAIAVAALWAFRSLRAASAVPMAILLIPLLLRTLVSLGFGGWVSAELLLFATLVVVAGESRPPGRSAALQAREFALQDSA